MLLHLQAARATAKDRRLMTFPWWFLGTAGLIAIEGSYLPQIFRLHRLKRANDVSIFFPALNLGGRLLALSYALLTHESVFTVGLIVGVILRATLLTQVVAYRMRGRVLTASSPRVAGLIAQQDES
jgi:lipid-A-disaccharide synthase-like uncharacterized protein